MMSKVKRMIEKQIKKITNQKITKTVNPVVKNTKKELKIGGYMFTYDVEMRLLHDEHEFKYKSKKYTDRFFKKELVKEISDNSKLYKDEEGNLVIYIYESIPVFDSGDREWNSYREIYITKVGDLYKGFYLTGGYHLAKVNLYTNMRSMNLIMKEIVSPYEDVDNKYL